VIQDELLAAFLEALAEGTPPPPQLALTHAAAMVRRAEEIAGGPEPWPLSVSELCSGCGVPRRTLNHAFQQVLGMGPATYLRRIRLNRVRRSLRQTGASAEPRRVTEIALEHGFWHPGRFSSQYRQLFGESPSQSRSSAGGRG
jgi:transcriptional regulator GlxA family with amidase domain